MKIAVSASSNNLESLVDPRFGRCPFFIIAEVEGNEIKNFEAIANPAMNAIGGAGIQAAQIVANKGVEAVICGNVGPNAFLALKQAGIKIITGVGGVSIRDAIKMYLNGELKETEAPTAPGVAPSTLSPFPGRGRGGRGRGFGGPPIECVCPKCGLRVPHQRGLPCSHHICPKCGIPMVRA